jgi:hypothetical protein
MPTIDARSLPDLPAPFWFIQFFKVLGFTLHAVPMNLWYAGALVAVAVYAFGGGEARRWGSRLALQIPIIVAAGINFGIVPLLFLQVAYAKAFYPATILMAWFWMAVIGLLIPAYYGVYVYASAASSGGEAMTPVKRAAGWCSAVFFVVIGFLFANALSLTTNVRAWEDLLERHSMGGAATGTALNVADPTLWPRWLLMFGLALVTTAAWTAVDTAWLAVQEDEAYKRWAQKFALRLAIAGAIWSTVAGTWYVFGTWAPEVHSEMFSFPLIFLTLLTGASPWAAPALLWLGRRKALTRAAAAAVGGAQVGVLAVNAISRQFVQNFELRRLFQPGVSHQPVTTDWGPMVMFLVVFVAGVGVLVWLFAQLAKAGPADRTA